MTRRLADISALIPNFRRRAALATLLALAQAAFLLPIALLVRDVFDRDVPRHHEVALLAAGLLIAGCYTASALATLASRTYAAHVTKESVGLMRRTLVEKLCALPMSWHDRNEAGTTHSVVIQDCERVDRMVIQIMSVALPAVLTAIGLTAVGAALNPLLFLVLLIALPVMVMVGQRFGRTFRRYLDAFHTTARALNAHAQLLLRGIATIRAAGVESHEVKRFNHEIEGFVQAGYGSAVAGSRYGVIQGAIASVAGIAVLVAGGILVAQHAITVGSLIAFYAVVALLLRQVSMVLSAAPVILEGQVAAARINALIATEEPQTYHGTRAIKLRGGVELRGVTFGYGERLALSDVSLVVAPGERIAVMGPNGAGKSSLLAMMLGLYRPAQGTVLVDGVPLAELDLPALRRQFGVVLQDAALFPGTIRDNITMGASEVRAEAVWQAASTAEATDFIGQLPDGFDTRLSDGGVGLSGGQRQRLAIARALLTRPALLLLDEPTASLPGDVSQRLMRRLCRLPWHPAVVVVTHDASVAAHAERVLRLDGGQLVDDSSVRAHLVAVSDNS